MKEYGIPDADLTCYNTLVAHVEGMPVKYILHHTRKPIDARACQLPLSLLVQAILENEVVISCVQAAPNQKARIT